MVRMAYVQRRSQRKDATMNTVKTPRRSFLRATAALSAAAAAASHLRAAGANDRLGVGVIGCGGRGGSHMYAYAQLAQRGVNVRIAAVCDVYKPRLARAADAHKAAAYMRHEDLLADPGVDVVSIATPDHVHGVQTIDAVRAKKDVYCEKPFTHWRQFEVTKRAIEEVKKSGRAFQLGTQGMSDRAWHQAAALIKEGAIGKPIHAECGYFRVGDWGERGMPVDDPNAQAGPDLDWKAFLGDAPARPFDASRFFRWRMYADYSGGPVTDLFPHSLTPVAHMLGAGAPAKAVAVGGKHRYDLEGREIPDTFNMLLEYPGGITVAVLGTQANDYQGTGARGAGGRSPVIRGWEGTITFEGAEIWVRPLGNKPPRKVPITAGEDWIQHFHNFLECCASGKTPQSPADLCFNVQTALHMGMLALQADRTARYDPEKAAIAT